MADGRYRLGSGSGRTAPRHWRALDILQDHHSLWVYGRGFQEGSVGRLGDSLKRRARPRHSTIEPRSTGLSDGVGAGHAHSYYAEMLRAIVCAEPEVLLNVCDVIPAEVTSDRLSASRPFRVFRSCQVSDMCPMKKRRFTGSVPSLVRALNICRN